MLLSRRIVMLALPTAAFAGSRLAAAQPGAAPVAVIERFYAQLLAVMKEANRLSFDERYNRLAPTISQTFDLPLMARIAVGPGWAQLAPDQQKRLSAAFARYTISVYANRFDGYDGERFVVLPTPTQNANGVIVDSQLVQSDGEKVVLDYLMRQAAGDGWRVIDVYLSGTVSELAARRSEFVSVLQREGADGLVQMIEKRTAKLRAG